MGCDWMEQDMRQVWTGRVKMVFGTGWVGTGRDMRQYGMGYKTRQDETGYGTIWDGTFHVLGWMRQVGTGMAGRDGTGRDGSWLAGKANPWKPRGRT